MAKKVKQQKISKNYMDSIFVHKPTLQWHITENESKKQIVVLDVENTGFFNKIAQKFFLNKFYHISSISNFSKTKVSRSTQKFTHSLSENFNNDLFFSNASFTKTNSYLKFNSFS